MSKLQVPGCQTRTGTAFICGATVVVPVRGPFRRSTGAHQPTLADPSSRNGRCFKLSSVGEVSSTSIRELPKHERACPMVALTRDFHVFASRVTTGFSAVFFSIWCTTQARYVRALLGLLTRHYDSVLSGHFSDPCRTAIINVAPFARPTRVSFMGLTLCSYLLVATLFRLVAFGSPNPTSPLAAGFPRLCAQQ